MRSTKLNAPRSLWRGASVGWTWPRYDGESADYKHIKLERNSVLIGGVPMHYMTQYLAIENIGPATCCDKIGHFLALLVSPKERSSVASQLLTMECSPILLRFSSQRWLRNIQLRNSSHRSHERPINSYHNAENCLKIGRYIAEIFQNREKKRKKIN